MALEYKTPEAVLALAKINAEYAEHVKANPLQPIPWTTPHAIRDGARPLTDEAHAKLANKGTNIKIPLRDGNESEILVHQPLQKSSAPSPLVVLCFGGAFITGENRQLSSYAGAIAHLYGATVVNLAYRLAPEHPFPTSHYDVWDTLLWLSDPANTKSIGADPSVGFILGGVSAGGNLAAAAAQRWVDEGKSPKLTGVWLNIPYVLDEINVPEEYKDLYLAREQNKDADILNDESFKWMKIHYQPDLKSPFHSPFNSPHDATRHRGMPPTFIQVNGMDPLRDDGLIYEHILRKAGVPTKLEIWPGLPHGHFVMIPDLEVSRSANLDIVRGFAWLLKVAEPSDHEITEALTGAPTSV